MHRLTPDSLLSLEAYARERDAFRARVMRHKKDRVVRLGDHLSLHFEDELTMRYQVQEMLRAERLFEPAEIQGELDAYNPLIPDGTNWKATLMLEYTDPAERAVRLAELVGIEHRVWMQVGELAPVTAIADEDLERTTEEKTSAVHFLRFELPPEHLVTAREGAPLTAGVDHPRYTARLELPKHVRASLARDLR